MTVRQFTGQCGTAAKLAPDYPRLINTPLQRGVAVRRESVKPFQRFVPCDGYGFSETALEQF